MKSLHVALLRELRIGPLWRLRDAGTDDAPGAGIGGAIGHSEAVPAETDAVRAEPPRCDLGAKPPPPVRLEPSPPRSPLESAKTDNAARETRIRSLDWDSLETEVRDCQACRLFEQRRQAVPGIGDRNAAWMFVGEGPGSEEDRRGEPFVGPAGKLLDAMLSALELERGKNVYIANAVKCRPPMNRTPSADEAETCRPFLERQIALVRPQVLVALGRPAAQTLLGTEVRINAVRGKVFSHDGIPVVVTFHPAYLLRNPSAKGKAWEDLCLARRVAGKAQDN